MLLIQQSTDKLNKFDTVRVDYFDKQRYWNDFQDLVRRPTAACLEYADDAVQVLYEMTEGNPFYTKTLRATQNPPPVATSKSPTKRA